MAIPFAAGAITQSLLNNSKQPNIIHNNFYIPLLEDQANLYMSTSEYKGKIEESSKAVFLYIDRKGYYQPKFLINKRTGEKVKITYKQACVLIEKEKIFKAKKHKIILMTKGIGGLPKSCTVDEEINILQKIRNIVAAILCPCCMICIGIPCCDDTVDLQNTRGEIEVDQVYFNILKI